MNNDKSRIYFSPNVEDYRRDMICSCLNLHSTSNLGTYLGFPLKNLGSTTQDFNFVVERVQRRLASWKANLLSFAG